MAELLAFKPSGQGAQVDLSNIIKSQIISWGGYKNQLRKKYTTAGGTKFIEGHEVFNDIDITSAVFDKDSDGYKLMKQLGFEDKDMEDLAAQKSNSDYEIEKMILEYTQSSNTEDEDLRKMLEEVKDFAEKKFTHIDIVVHNNMYEPGTEPLGRYGLRNLGLEYETISNELELLDKCEQDKECIKNYQEEDWYFTRKGNGSPPENTATRINKKRIMESLQITFKNGNANVTSEVPLALRYFYVFLAAVEPSMISLRNSSSYVTTKDIYDEIEEDQYEYSGDGIWNMLVIGETYVIENLDINRLMDKKNYYTTTCEIEGICSDEATDEEKETKIPSYSHSAYLWEATKLLIQGDLLELTNGLFAWDKGEQRIEFGIGGELTYTYPDAKIYMTVEGLRKTQPGEFGYYMSTFLNIKYIKKRHGFFQRFIRGLIKAFLNFIDAIIGIFLKIPILKQITELVLSVIGSLFGVDATTAREILTQIIAAIIIIIIAPYAIEALSAALTSTSAALIGTTATTTTVAGNLAIGLTPGIQTAITMTSNALNIYNAAMTARSQGLRRQMDIAQTNRDYAREKMQEQTNHESTTFAGTMGSMSTYEGSNAMMYDMMFNPFYNFNQAVPAAKLEEGYLF